MDWVPLGASGIRVPPMGTGTWAWGDRMIWAYGQGFGEEDLGAAFRVSVQQGVPFFDTAEIYGSGRSESLLGRFLQETARGAAPASGKAQGPGGADGDSGPPVRPIIATKFMPWPWRLTRRSLLDALRRSLDRLGLPAVDLYQIHHPLPPVPPEVWANALADAVQAGLVRAVGVSNYSAARMRRAHAVLTRRGIPLASNQVEYSLIRRHAERNGLAEACAELGVTLIAYSPLGMGLLTGKYGPATPPPGVRGRRYSRGFLQRLVPLLETLRELGEAHGGRTPGQVALNWVIQKGAIPIPGAKNERQARENAGALTFQLTPDEVAALDEASEALS